MDEFLTISYKEQDANESQLNYNHRIHEI